MHKRTIRSYAWLGASNQIVKEKIESSWLVEIENNHLRIKGPVTDWISNIDAIISPRSLGLGITAIQAAAAHA